MESAPIPFVEGWEFVQTLGEGAYGEVKLAVSQATQECVAVKIIHVTHKSVEENVKKEICILRMLEHKNVIKFYGYRRASDVQYLFLKYASGGELFDRIEPDVGTNMREALRYFHDLIQGVEYLHSRGVCHRDLKPENLLFDENDVLQITDFGMATIFRHKGEERDLNRMCGTKPYTAPEVLRGLAYKGEPVDVWSCGIILVALLAGELPWDEPLPRNELYQNWKECRITTNPWNKIDTLALSLCRSVLCENPQRRYNIEQIKKHQFYNKSFVPSAETGALASPTSPPLNNQKRRRINNSDDISASQPECLMGSDDSMDAEETHTFSFSQPTHTDDLLVNSQLQCTPGTSQTPFQKLVKRMTRFFVIHTKQETVVELMRMLESEGYQVKKNAISMVTVSVLDRRKSKLIFKIGLIDMGGNILVDFRLSKGDGLEFKRHFVRIKHKLKHIIRKTCPSLFAGFVDSRPGSSNASCQSPLPSKNIKDEENRDELLLDDPGKEQSNGNDVSIRNDGHDDASHENEPCAQKENSNDRSVDECLVKNDDSVAKVKTDHVLRMVQKASSL